MLHVAVLAMQLACGHVTVKPGDTLSELATEHGKTWRYVWQENAWIKNPNLIYPGEEVTICDVLLNVVSQPIQSTSYPHVLHNEPCRSLQMWPQGSVYMWETPVGCYGGVYYVGRGDCWGWVSYLTHGELAPIRDIRPGESVHIPPGEQGAGPLGHWAYILSIKRQGNQVWALISEENMYWRGGGYGKVSYRYLLLKPDMVYYQ